MIHDKDVYVRTGLGVEEYRAQKGDVLPRLARTLLILFDGRKSLGQVKDGLQHLQKFKEGLHHLEMVEESGGVEQYVELLLNLGFIEAVDSAGEMGRSSKSAEVNESAASIKQNSFAASSIKQAQSSQASGRQDIGAPIDESFEARRSNIASLIEQYAEPQQSWALMLELEGCKDMSELNEFIKQVFQDDNSALSKAVSKFVK